MVSSKLVLLFCFISQLASQKESGRKFAYNPGPQGGCKELGRAISIYNFQCKGGFLGDSNDIQADEKPPPTPTAVRPVIYNPYRPFLNFFLPVRRFTPIRYADLTRPIINRPFTYQDQGSSVINTGGSVVGSPTRIQFVRPQTVYRPQSPLISSSNPDNVYNPFRPESSTNIRPTPPPENRPEASYPSGTESRPPVNNPFRPDSQASRPINNVQTPSPLIVDYFGTPIPTYTTATTTRRPNYAVPAYPINLPTNRPFSPSSISNSYYGNRPGLSPSSTGILSTGNRPGSGFTQVTGNRPDAGFTQVAGNRPGSDNVNRPTIDHRPVIEDYDDDDNIDKPTYEPFGSNLIGGVTSSVNGFLQNFNGQTLIPGRSILRSFLDLF